MRSCIAMLWAWPNAFPRLFTALGWLLVAAWLYVHTIVFAANHYRALLPPQDSLLVQMFEWALAASFLSPLWVFAAIVLALLSAGFDKRPSASDVAVFFLVLGLIGLYLGLGFLD
jgi:hypothetical protein